MTRLLKSDLTYSLCGGFLLGALTLFFMQPGDQPQAGGESLTSTVSVAGQLPG